mgnify:CR=1 FL=1|tara:strand:+ start:8455 stop:8736 length:282 start_codon:yes stop_codon:yes gene_type:complete
MANKFLKTLGTNLQEDYTGGLMENTELPGSGSYSQYMINTGYVGDTGDVQGITSSALLEAMQAMVVNGYRAAVNEAKEGENSQLKQLAKKLKV